ncbi:MAG: hypothetical protein KGJ77_00875 [Acidobacteriota bacterium]|nr:hypothetical protein [Acidobacteriota bacterium]
MELLDHKRQLLRRELERLQEQRRASAGGWLVAAGDAERGAVRAGLLAGHGRIELLGAPVAGHARVEVDWRNTMGVRFPAGARCSFPELEPAEEAASSASVPPAASALRLALAAAARHAVDQRASDAIEAELTRTDQQLRAIERRRVPALETALRLLELRLDELERQERVVTRWARRRAVAHHPPSQGT